MFEAHTLSAQEINAEAPSGQHWKQPRSISHHLYQCPVHCWLAAGKRKDDNGIYRHTWFLYIEYRRKDRSCGWVCREVELNQATASDLFRQAAEIELPDISPEYCNELGVTPLALAS